jgi:hypothetical protein
VQVDCLYIADILADAALLFLEVKAAFIYVGDKRDGLGEVDVDRFVVRDLLVVFVRVGYRAILDAGTASGAGVFEDVPRFFRQSDGKISSFAGNTVNFCVGENFDIWVPADLDQFR